MLNFNMCQMKSLHKTRIEKGISRKDIAESLGISIANLSQLESGKQCPSILTRRRLELYFGERINFLDVPNLKTSPHYETDFDSCEREFRGIVRMIKGLPQQDIEIFLNSAIKHLRKMQVTGQLQSI